MSKVNLLNVFIDSLSLADLLKKLDLYGGIVFTPNVDHLMQLQTDPDFHKVYKIANYVVCDSQILIYASKFLGTPIKEKISGSDLFPAFYKYFKRDPNIKIFLLGASAGVAEEAQAKINAKAGRNIVVETYSPSFGFENNEQECLEIIDKINKSEATVLAIGVGAPKQEKWIYKYRAKLKNIRIFLAIGATIDFESGIKKRSPKWMSQLGLEWLHRLLSEPRRLWKRYLIKDHPFLGLILKQKFNLYKMPFTSISEEEPKLS